MERLLPKLTVNPVLTLEDLGLDQTAGLEEASRGLAEVSEAQIVRWTQFPAGALFFTMVADDPESGGFYVFDRKQGVFYWLDFDDQKWGGYTVEDYESLERSYKLSLVAQRPWMLKNWDSASRLMRTGRARLVVIRNFSEQRSSLPPQS